MTDEVIGGHEKTGESTDRTLFRKCTPSVFRARLWLLAGLVWSGVGILLCVMACSWIAGLDWPMNMAGAIVGFGSGILIYRYGFSRLARKNIARIGQLPEKVCLFAFQAWRSYALIVVMMALGYILRHAHLPLVVLSIIYSGIGTGLTLSSSLYYRQFL